MRDHETSHPIPIPIPIAIPVSMGSFSNDPNSHPPPNQPSSSWTWFPAFSSFLCQNRFIFLAFLVITFSFCFPDIGRKGGPLHTEITAPYVANVLVFVIAGLTLEMSALWEAIRNTTLNLLVLANIFALTTAWFWILAALVRARHVLPEPIIDGIVILGCLPTTINMCVVFTGSGKGNVPSALFLATASNAIGIVLTPAYIFGFLGSKADTSFMHSVESLMLQVILPTVVGQILKNITLDSVQHTIAAFQPHAKLIQELLLLFIIFASFSTTFNENIPVQPTDVFVLFLLMWATQSLFYIVFWAILSVPLLNLPTQDKIAGLFCSVHKTLAVGVPIIHTLYGHDKAVGLFTLPLLVYHPYQIVAGAILVKKLAALVSSTEIPSHSGTQLDGTNGAPHPVQEEQDQNHSLLNNNTPSLPEKSAPLHSRDGHG